MRYVGVAIASVALASGTGLQGTIDALLATRVPGRPVKAAVTRRLPAAAVVATVVLLQGCGERVRPASLETCLERPHNGYATPALKGRLRRCAAFLASSEPPRAWQLGTHAARLPPLRP